MNPATLDISIADDRASATLRWTVGGSTLDVVVDAESLRILTASFIGLMAKMREGSPRVPS